MYIILAFLSTLEECGDFFGKFVQEPHEDFNFFIAQMYGVAELETHMTSNGTQLLSSQRARHHIQRTVHWLEKSFIPAKIDLEDRVANQICEKIERKIEAAGKARSKVQASEATALALAEHADRNIEDLEQKKIIVKSADIVEKRPANRNKKQRDTVRKSASSKEIKKSNQVDQPTSHDSNGTSQSSI
jgi:hypothetical protein